MKARWEVAEQCGACGEPRWTQVSAIHAKRYGRCDGCGLVRLIDRLAPDDLPLIYGNYYRTNEPSPAELAEQLRNPTFVYRRARIERALNGRPRTLFEIGCGDGNFLALLKQSGWSVAGSEYGATAARVAERHAIDVRPVDSLDDVTPAAASVICAYHVLEHIYEPREWLAAAARMTGTGGILHLQVPNYAAWSRTVAGIAWASWRLPEHVYFYTPTTLQRTLEAAGFRILSTNTWDPWHGPGVATTSLVNMLLMRRTGRSPWTSDIQQGWPAGGADSRVRHPGSIMKRSARGGVTAAAHVLSRMAALARRGDVIDVIAERR